jgi:hypothetical protein
MNDKRKNSDLPEAPAIAPDQSKLSPIQQRVFGYVSTAKKDPPRITDVNELFRKIEMAIPDGVSRGPEFDYAWLSIEDLYSISGSKWEIVNRNNHSHVPNRLFDASGGILYKGQNILAFCYRETRELEQAAIVKHYNDKTNRITEVKERAVEGAVSMIDEKSAGTVFNSGSIDTIAEPMGFQKDKDDF